MAEVIANVLSISLGTVDPEASFQELGGSSPDAIVLASNLRKINIHVSVSDILQSSSVGEIAAYRTKSKIQGDVAPPQPFSLIPESVKLDLSGSEDACPATPLQESILADVVLSNVNYVYQRIYKLQGVSPTQVRSAMEEVLARNTILRTTFLPWKKSFLQVVNPTAILPWTNVRCQSLENFLDDMSTKEMSFDKPLIRVSVVNDEILVVEMHHALFDFWSRQFIIEDTIAILQGSHSISRLPFSSYVLEYLQYTLYS